MGIYGSSTAIALYILACAIISLIATALLKDYTGKDLAQEHQEQAAQ